jgi:hypothetical protein
MSSAESPARSTADGGLAGGRALLAAGTATYGWTRFAPLDQVPRALAAVVETLTGLGYAAVAADPGYQLDPTVDDLRVAVRAAAAAADVVVVYYTGHGFHPERDVYYLVNHQ